MTSPSFDPLHPIDKHLHRLPHWQQGEAWQFTTWRLADSLPQEKLAIWRAERSEWYAAHPQPWEPAIEQEYHHRFTGRIEVWLDAGYGSCSLREPDGPKRGTSGTLTKVISNEIPKA